MPIEEANSQTRNLEKAGEMTIVEELTEQDELAGDYLN